MKAKQWVLTEIFSGTPKSTDLTIIEVELPDLKDGEVLLECVVISVDPYQRGRASRSKAGDTMAAEQVAKVIESKCTDLPVGTHVTVFAGWSTHCVVAGDTLKKVPEYPEGVPMSLALGALGMPGMAAYYGLMKAGSLQDGETVYVNAAAGAVGTLVGQIAKIKGCKVIGSAGSDEKVTYLKTELGFDEAINYKTVSDLTALDKKLKELAPKGIDVFFECVGGAAFTVVLDNMAENGRVAMIGNISSYNTVRDKYEPVIPNFHPIMYKKKLSIIGFQAWDWMARDKEQEGYKEMFRWIQEGKLIYPGHNFNGIENCFKAFMSLFSGDHIGKVLVTM